MKIICIKAFGFKVPGDEVDVPDGSVFDEDHFKLAPKPPEVNKTAKPVKAPAKGSE